MTDIQLIPERKILEQRKADNTFLVNDNATNILFEKAICLTGNSLIKHVAFEKREKVIEQFEKNNPNKSYIIYDKNTPITLHSFPRFHYFSDGTLIHTYLNQDMEKYVKKILHSHGFEVNKIYKPKDKLEQEAYREIMHKITTKVWDTYGEKAEFVIEELPAKEVFVKNCFANENILLTATDKSIKPFNPSCRKFLAVFANGDYYISKDYSSRMWSFHGNIQVQQFEENHKDLILFNPVYVPKEYIEALYKEAEKYDWFIDENVATEFLPQESDAEKAVLKKYMEDLFQNRICICVTIPRFASKFERFLEFADFTSPERERYVLFNDGKLLLSKAKHLKKYEDKNQLIQNLQKCFPHIHFQIEYVPDYYIDRVLEKVSEKQKNAAEIYVEMLKQKARRLKKWYNIRHFESLDLVAKLAGWENWKSVNNITEQHARHLIAIEQDISHRQSYSLYPEQTQYNDVISILNKMKVNYKIPDSLNSLLKQ